MFKTKETTIFQKHFFLKFRGFREARTFKIKQKRCTVVQNRRYHRFLEKHRLVRNTPESKPQRDPRNPTKSKKTQTGPPLKTCTGVAGSGQVAERPGRASQDSAVGVPQSPVSIFTYRCICFSCCLIHVHMYIYIYICIYIHIY